MTEQQALDQIINADLKARFASGDLTVTFGEKNWREGYYTDPWVRVSIPVTCDIARHLPSVKSYHIHYDNQEDFQLIDFEFEGIKYQIRWYKVFAVKRLTDNKSILFGRASSEIGEFFARGKHKDETKWY